MMKIYRAMGVCIFLLVAVNLSWSQQIVFDKVKARFSKSDNDRRLNDKNADLILDDGARQLLVKNRDKPLQVGYDAIRRIVFDVSVHMRGGALSQALGGFGGEAVGAMHVKDFWCHIEYEAP